MYLNSCTVALGSWTCELLSIKVKDADQNSQFSFGDDLKKIESDLKIKKPGKQEIHLLQRNYILPKGSIN